MSLVTGVGVRVRAYRRLNHRRRVLLRDYTSEDVDAEAMSILRAAAVASGSHRASGFNLGEPPRDRWVVIRGK